MAANGPAAAADVPAGSRLLGIAPVVSATVPATEGLMRLEPNDVMEEPDTLPTYAEISAFMKRQSQLVHCSNSAR